MDKISEALIVPDLPSYLSNSKAVTVIGKSAFILGMVCRTRRISRGVSATASVATFDSVLDARLIDLVEQSIF